MASGNVIAALVVFFAVSLLTLSRATDHIVGDEFGWTPGFNYTTWAQGKEFRVRDTLGIVYLLSHFVSCFGLKLLALST